MYFGYLLVERIGAQQVLVRVEACYHTIVHHDDAVAVSDALYALGYDELCHVGQLLSQRLTYVGIGGCVAGRCRVVEYQYLRFFQQGAGYAQSLLLTAADVCAALLYVGVIALGHLTDELVSLSQPAGLAAFFKRCFGVAPTQVVQYAAREENIVLQHHGNGLAECRQVVFLHVTATHQHLALRRVVETADQADQRGLTAARSADDADAFAVLDGEGNVVEGRALVRLVRLICLIGLVRLVSVIVKSHLPELYAAVADFGDGSF